MKLKDEFHSPRPTKTKPKILINTKKVLLNTETKKKVRTRRPAQLCVVTIYLLYQISYLNFARGAGAYSDHEKLVSELVCGNPSTRTMKYIAQLANNRVPIEATAKLKLGPDPDTHTALYEWGLRSNVERRPLEVTTKGIFPPPRTGAVGGNTAPNSGRFHNH